MSSNSGDDPKAKPTVCPVVNRRSATRTRDDADWESKVVGRLNGRLQHLPIAEGEADGPGAGWESSVLDVLRNRIEKGPR